MIHFPDTTLQRHVPTTSSTGVYGETTTEYAYSSDIIVDFQNESNNEVARSYGVELEDLYKIYLDINTPLGESDLLYKDNDCYEIIGGIKEYPKFHKYKKAHLRRRRKAK